MSKHFYDLAIIGGGASGMAVAISAARTFENEGKSQFKIAIFEALPRLGKKILATGNGRCNLTNKNLDKSFYFENANFAINLIKRADNNYTENFFKSLGLLTRADEAGRVYPNSNQASSVLDALRFAIEKYKITVFYESKVNTVLKDKDIFLINNKYKAQKIILASGGKSSSKLGSDGSGYEILKSLGIKVLTPYPALTGLVLDKSYPSFLKGVRAECKIEIREGKNQILAKDYGEVQFNQNGVSGIPVMQVSRFASMKLSSSKVYLYLDRLPSLTLNELRDFLRKSIEFNPSLKAENLLTGLMPKKLGLACIKEAGILPSLPYGKIKSDQINTLARLIKSHFYRVEGTNGFEASQVTCGGACTSEFIKDTLESKKIKGFYCCGEVLNVDGLCGGYNLQWAWSSGLISGRSAAESLMVK